MDSPLVRGEGVCEIDFGRNRTMDDFRDRMTERGFDLIPPSEAAIQPV